MGSELRCSIAACRSSGCGVDMDALLSSRIAALRLSMNGFSPDAIARSICAWNASSTAACRAGCFDGLSLVLVLDGEPFRTDAGDAVGLRGEPNGCAVRTGSCDGGCGDGRWAVDEAESGGAAVLRTTAGETLAEPVEDAAAAAAARMESGCCTTLRSRAGTAMASSGGKTNDCSSVVGLVQATAAPAYPSSSTTSSARPGPLSCSGVACHLRGGVRSRMTMPSFAVRSGMMADASQ